MIPDHPENEMKYFQTVKKSSPSFYKLRQVEIAVINTNVHIARHKRKCTLFIIIIITADNTIYIYLKLLEHNLLLQIIQHCII